MSQDEVLRLVARAKDEASGPLRKIRESLRAMKEGNEGPIAARKAFTEWNESLKVTREHIDKVHEASRRGLEPALDMLNLKTVAAASGVGLLVEGLKHFAERGDELTGFSNKVRLSIETVRGFDGIAEKFHVDPAELRQTEMTLVDSMYRVRKHRGEFYAYLKAQRPQDAAALAATPDTEAGNEQALRISLRMLEKIKQERGEATARIFAKENFGSDALVDLIREGLPTLDEAIAKYRALSGSFDASKGEEFTKGMADLKAAAEGFGNIAGAEFLPKITEGVKELTEYVSGHKQEIEDGLVTTVHDVGEAARVAWPAISGVATAANTAATAMGGWGHVLEGYAAFKLAGYAFGFSRLAFSVFGLAGAFRALGRARASVPDLKTGEQPKAIEPRSSVTGRKPTGPMPEPGALANDNAATASPANDNPGPKAPSGKSVLDDVTDGAKKLAAAGGGFADGAASLGTVLMLGQWAAKSDIGLHRDLTPESLSKNPLGLKLPGEPGYVPGAALPPRPVAPPPAPAQPADEFGRDPAVIESQAKTFSIEPISEVFRNAMRLLNPISEAHGEELPRRPVFHFEDDRETRARAGLDPLPTGDRDLKASVDALNAARRLSPVGEGRERQQLTPAPASAGGIAGDASPGTGFSLRALLGLLRNLTVASAVVPPPAPLPRDGVIEEDRATRARASDAAELVPSATDAIFTLGSLGDEVKRLHGTLREFGTKTSQSNIVPASLKSDPGGLSSTSAAQEIITDGTYAGVFKALVDFANQNALGKQDGRSVGNGGNGGGVVPASFHPGGSAAIGFGGSAAALSNAGGEFLNGRSGAVGSGDGTATTESAGADFTAGMRARNLGNIGYFGQHETGLVGPSNSRDVDHSIAMYATQEDGIRAAARLALRKYESGMRSTASLIAGPHGWTPGSLGPGASINVAHAMGLTNQDDLHLDQPDQMRKFLHGLAVQEHGASGGRYYSDAMIGRALSGSQASRPAGGLGSAGNGNAVGIAEGLLGANGQQAASALHSKMTPGEWCADFVNGVLKGAGGKGVNSSLASTFRDWGTEVAKSSIKRGDVLVKNHHVGIATGEVDGQGRVGMVSGNHGHRVGHSWEGLDSILAARRAAVTSDAAAAAQSAADAARQARDAATPAPDTGLPRQPGELTRRSNDAQTMKHKVEGNGELSVKVDAPRGTRVGASGGGLFKKVSLNRGYSMTSASETA